MEFKRDEESSSGLTKTNLGVPMVKTDAELKTTYHLHILQPLLQC